MTIIDYAFATFFLIAYYGCGVFLVEHGRFMRRVLRMPTSGAISIAAGIAAMLVGPWVFAR